MPPVVIASAVLGTAAVGAAVYAGEKADKAQAKAAEQARINNQAIIDAANAQAEKDREAAAKTAQDIAAQGAADSKAIIDAATANNQSQLDAIKAGNAATSSWQAAMLAEQKNATQEAKKAAEMALKNSAQKARNPNYSTRLSANAAANRKGIAGTMLTGPGGVDPSTLTLGRTTLLGAGA